jgi:hypothetical protein
MSERKGLICGWCRYVYVEFYMFPLEEGMSFEDCVRRGLGAGCTWEGCWESGALDWPAEGRWKQRRRLLIRFCRPLTVKDAQWIGTLGFEMATEVAELQSWSFCDGVCGGAVEGAEEFVESCVEKISRYGMQDGYAAKGSVVRGQCWALRREGAEHPLRQGGRKRGRPAMNEDICVRIVCPTAVWSEVSAECDGEVSEDGDGYVVKFYGAGKWARYCSFVLVWDTMNVLRC